VDADSWEPLGYSEGTEFQLLLGLLPAGGEREGVLKFPAFRDQKRCLLGRLLARRACARALGLADFSGLEVGRTFGQKPFLQGPLPSRLPNFNFSVSHDGRWVVLASDPLRLVGADVSAPQRARGDREDDSWLQDLENVLTDKERAYIEAEQTPRARYSVFQRIWSAKEAVTKAVGSGLDFGLERIEVTLDGVEPPDGWQGWQQWWGRPKEPQAPAPHGPPWASVEVDQWPRPEWQLRQEALPGGHWATVALGPVEEVEDRNGEFSRTLRLRHVDAVARHMAAVTHFEVLPVAALVPQAAAEALSAAQRQTHGHMAWG